MVKKITIVLMAVLSMQCLHAQEVGPKVTQFDWSRFEFTYTDGNNVEHVAKLTDEAQTTDHIIALLRAVYLNENVPGIRYAYAYQHPGDPLPSLHRLLNYGFNYTSHLDSYPGSYTNHGNSHGRGGGGEYNTWDRSLDSDILPIQNPVEDGMTVMLVQLNESWNTPRGGGDHDNAPALIDSAWNSLQVVTAFTRVHDENNPGYLFAIDGTATNKFFFISKGKPRASSSRPLFRLYEQISPVKGDHGATTYDFISKMKSGQVYYCFHDCYDVTTYDRDKDHGTPVGHWFTISNQGEAYSLKNLCLYVPDRRFENELRDEDPEMDGLSWYDDNAKKYTNYGHNEGSTQLDSIIRPKVLMYTADLNAEAVPSEVEDYYRVNLDWSTSFTDQKIGAHVPEHYYVYIVKDDGSWVRIDDLLNKNEPVENTSDSYLVEQTYETQVFNYVITAHPINYDMDGHMIMDGMDTLNTDCEKPLVTITAVSPVRTVVIPPLGMPFFQRMLEYRSFYNVNSEENFYRNGIAIKSSSEEDFNSIRHMSGTFAVTRTDPDNHKETIAHVTITQNAGQIGYDYHVDYVEETQQDVSNGLFGNGEPVIDGTIYTVADEIIIYDRFRASTETNSHYNRYVYRFEQMRVDGNGGPAFQEVCSNPLTVPVFKTTNLVETEGYTREDVLGDRDHHLDPRPTNKISFSAYYDPSANLAEYDVLRVNKEYHPIDEFKVGKAENFNNSGEYHVITVGEEGYLNNLEQTLKINTSTDTTLITVHDKHGAVANRVSSYVPTIITLYGGDQSKVNTYGCEIKDMSYPQLNLDVSAEKSNSFKHRDDDGNLITSKGYTASLHLTPILTDDMKYAYYYRVWRVVDGEESEVLLNELKDFGGTSSMNNATWSAIYSSIQETYPGENSKDVCDIIVKPYNDEEDDDFNVTYIARLYATYIEGEGWQDVVMPDAPKRVGEHGGKDYVVVEQRVTVNFKNVPTDVAELSAYTVADVTYYNLQGVPSSRPYQGLNIVVTRYANGKTVTEKKML